MGDMGKSSFWWPFKWPRRRTVSTERALQYRRHLEASAPEKIPHTTNNSFYSRTADADSLDPPFFIARLPIVVLAEILRYLPRRLGR